MPKLFRPLRIWVHMTLLTSDPVVDLKRASIHLQVNPNMIDVLDIWNCSIADAGQEYIPLFLYTMHDVPESGYI